MKTEVLDILMYLFETYLDDDQSDITSEETIRNELAKIGFQDTKVTKAFDWLDDFSLLEDDFSFHDTLECHSESHTENYSIRLFSQYEIEKFDKQARGVLLEMVELHVISPGQREFIIDKALALEIAYIDQEQMKWVILMVLFNLPDSAGSFTWIQDLLYEDRPTIH
ncbi:MAG: DUF494 domain-containing protein [gamma proteobacterium symbiont of Lucinoma myriamae]|nr:DUF494 domain-containing protein [gamma proteobacterium symbiont of Lucinoma myriamae]MCU7818083.1 DUF494 domain-containing protein [gamma proteobacterium symbiont of Lucinoma myriamae]MCU7833358.1 DUF494 domain-containing protein [gamma proteobacterium symbiont of Lucinoma myriamae]